MSSTYPPHDGVVVKKEGKTVFVRILVKSGCASCEIKSACSLAEMEEKLVEVSNVEREFEIGQKVMITMRSALGYKALFYAYLLPFLIILASLIVGMSAFESEGLSALLAFGLTALYYLGLFYMKDRLKRVFTYELYPL